MGSVTIAEVARAQMDILNKEKEKREKEQKPSEETPPQKGGAESR